MNALAINKNQPRLLFTTLEGIYRKRLEALNFNPDPDLNPENIDATDSPGTHSQTPQPEKTDDALQTDKNELAAGIFNPRLAGIDAAVKAHEKVHLSILGGYAKGTINYDYIILANGEKYAVGGSVGVDTKPVPGDPEATIRKARIIRFAALGPNSPSGPDQQIAAQAYRMEMLARRELEKGGQEEQTPGSKAVLQAAGLLPGAPAAEDPISSDVLVVPGDPEATIRNARAMRREAMQGGLSAHDRQKVVNSYLLEMQARRELQAGKEGRPGIPGIDMYV